MTINLADNNPRIAYSVAQGVTQTVFAVPFEFFEDADVNVYVDGVLKAEGTDYTLTGGEGATGTLTFVTADPGDPQQVTGATGGSKVVLVRRVAIERVTDFQQGVDIPRPALNEQLDVLTALIADLDDRIDRTIHLNDSYAASPDLSIDSLTPFLGKALVFNVSTGKPEAGPSASDVANAQTYAANAAASASAAASSASAASGSASAAASSASAAASSESHAASSEAAAAASEAAAAASESAAASSASSASSSASSASSSASAASASASNAAASESNAAASASAAAGSASTASSAAASALAALDSFDDRYLGAKASDPIVDNDGDPLVAGALYFNTVSEVMKLYTGSAWVAAYVSGEASNVAFTPTGDIAATNVQTAIAELDTEKVPRTSTTGAALIPVGTDAQRPTAATGQLRFNTDEGKFEGYDGTAWGNIGGGGGFFKGENGEIGDPATGPGDIFRINEQTLNTNVTIDSDENASCTGPLTVASGVTLTVNGNLAVI